MAPKKVGSVGKVKIKLQKSDGTYYLAWPNPTGGAQRLESTGFRANTSKQLTGDAIPRDVMRAAGRKNDELTRPGYAVHSAAGPSVSEAMEVALHRGRNKCDGWMANLTAAANYFGDFIEVRFPEITHWEQIRPSHVYAYIESQASHGVKAKTLRHYTTIVTTTARYWNNEDPDRFRPISLVHPLLTQPRKVQKKYLTARQLAILLDYARQSDNPGVLPAVVLGGYAGLNLAEIMRLDKSNFDHKAGTMTIKESKNEFRPRTIPLLPLVRAWATDFTPIHKVNGDPATDDTLGKAVRRVMDKVSRDLRAEADRSTHPGRQTGFRSRCGRFR